MGVTGLWKLVEPCGNPVPVETLEGNILAVDASIWLHQVVKGFQDGQGSSLPHAHLLGLFHRLCKLLYHKVRPVFVFDGCVPQLKLDTIARRQQQRSKLNSEADRIQALLLQSLAKEKVVQQALGANAELLIQSPSKRDSVANKVKKDKDDMFNLPKLPIEEEPDTDTSNTKTLLEPSTSTKDGSSDESNPWREYNANLQAIDVLSEHFKSLPPEIRHEILVDIKETRKQSSWGRLHELPSCSDDFSSFQVKRLLKRRAVQESIQEAEKEMGERALTFTDLQNFFTEEGILEPDDVNKITKPVCSDEAIRFTLVRDLKKTLSENKDVADVPKQDSACPTRTNLKLNKNEKVNMEQMELPGEQYDTDLKRAIAISLEDIALSVYNTEDHEYGPNENLLLNRKHGNQLENSAIGPARAFMIEYGGMIDEEVEAVMDKTHEDFDDGKAISDSLEDKQYEANYAEKMKINEAAQCNQKPAGFRQEISLRVSDSSEVDSDLEEVEDNVLAASELESKNSLEVIIELNDQLVSEDDLFSDVFESSPKRTSQIDTEERLRDLPISSPENVESVVVHNVMETSGKCNEIKNDEEMQYDKTNAVPYILNMNDDNKKMSSILDELKKQADDIKKLNLDDVNICESDEKFTSKNEIIEIYDSDDQNLGPEVTPSKSTKFRTPSKDKSINEYFETKYVVKRTPESDRTEQEQKEASNVKSPYFVKKSPSSHRKRSVRKIRASRIHEHKLSRVSKTLFESAITTSGKELEIKEDGPDLKSEDVPKSAVGILKQQKTTEQLQSLASDLVKEQRDLENERNRQDRMGTAITHNMHTECQELLKLFGVPYIIAPMEAEAQCAFLESVNLTNGTITDDSDIWLFGGRTVYKNFFEQNKHVLKFEADKIRHTFNCDREQLIQLACLVGSDYTTGIHGIGTVTALEILAAFSPKSNNSQESCTRNDTTTGAVLSTLCRFRDWLKVHKNVCQPVGSSTCLKLRKKLNNIELKEGFPSPAVVEAYLFPKVDDSKAPFRWGYPDVDSLYAFTKKVFGWTANKTDAVLKPVLKRMNDKQTQTSIRNYFTIKSALKPRELKISKRVQKAIDTMASVADTSDIIDTKPAKRSRRTKKQNEASKTQQQLELDSNNPDAMTNIVVDIPSTSASCLAYKTNKSTPRLLETQEVIPQREKDIQKMRQRKQKAAAILRKSRTVVSTATAIEERRAN